MTLVDNDSASTAVQSCRHFDDEGMCGVSQTMQYTLHMDGTRYRFVRQDRGLLRSKSSREQYQDEFKGPRRARPRRVLDNN